MAGLVRFNPNNTMSSLMSRDPFFHGLLDSWDSFFDQENARPWAPSMNLMEEKDALVVEVDLPGMDPKDVEIQLQGDHLTIRGERKVEDSTQDRKVLRREFAHGTFERSLRLPVQVNADKVEATSHHGVLRIHMPKAEEYVGRRIPVKVK